MNDPAALLARLVFACLMLGAGTAAARVLEVGPGRAYPRPSAAAAVAQDGDTVTIAPGEYFDCAGWNASHLTVAGPPDGGPGAVITDKACSGKAAFVIAGDDVTVRNLTFARLRVPDGNGAGIRAEGRGLTVMDSRFLDNQVGILAAGEGGSLRIADCVFAANGVSLDGQPTHAVLAGRLDLLRIERSVFQRARGGDHIVSAALATDLLDNHLTDEGGHMAGPLVRVDGGALTLSGNIVELAPGAADRPGAVLVTGDANVFVVYGNTLIEPAGSVPLLRNWTGFTAVAAANTVPPGGAAVSEAGSLYHRLRARLAALRDATRVVAGMARHQAAVLVGRGM